MTVKTRSNVKAAPQQRNMMILGGIIGAAVLAAVLLILLNSSSSANLDADIYTEIPQRRGDDGAFILGNPEAPIKIIEFADFACPACQSYKPDVNRLIENYIATGQAQLELRILPTAGSDVTRYAAKLLECSEELKPNSFWHGHEVMYELAIGRNYTMELARPFAERMELDVGQLISCTRTATQGTADERYAQSLGANSTPTVLVSINGQRPQPVNSRYNDLATLIESVQP